jgi:hypothetical protein
LRSYYFINYFDRFLIIDQRRREARASAEFTEHGGLKHCKNIEHTRVILISGQWSPPVKIKSAEI